MKLDYHIFKSMVNGYIGLHIDLPRRSTFFKTVETKAGLEAVTKANPAIRKEFE